jgi:NitT/TauT family transport system substrate-binding protein
MACIANNRRRDLLFGQRVRVLGKFFNLLNEDCFKDAGESLDAIDAAKADTHAARQCGQRARFNAMKSIVAAVSKLNGAVMRAARSFTKIVIQMAPKRRMLGVFLISTIAGTVPSLPAAARDLVTMRLGWTMEGQYLPYVWALDQGYFAAEGIDVKILEGRGSGNTAQLVGAKTDTFGGADASSAALARAEGAPVKVIATFIQRSEGTVVSYAASRITKPADLIGKKVATSQGSSSAALFQVMLKASGIPESKIDLVGVQSTAKVASLLQRRVDAITGLMTSECVLVKQKSPGQQIACMPMADFGVKSLGAGLIVNDDTLKQDPDLVRRFVLASTRGWTEAVKDPAKAAVMGKKDFPLTSTAILQAQLEALVPFMHSHDSLGHPIGWMAEADWRDTIATLRSYMGLTSAAPVADYYTDEFLPAQKQN